MDRKAHVKQTIENFITATKEKRLTLCSFGVEVETQAENDNSHDFWDVVYNNLDYDDYVDTNALCETIAKEIDRYISSTPLSELIRLWARFWPSFELKSNYSILCKKLYDKRFKKNDILFKEYYLRLLADRVERIEKRLHDLDDDIKIKLFNKYVPFLEPIKDINDINERFNYCIEEHIRDDFNESEYQLDEDTIRRNHPDLFKGGNITCDHDKVEVVDDQSITGKELRTVGGLNQEDFIDAARAIFDAISDSDHYVDTDCSAHLHIKLGDIKHIYGNGVLHAAIMEYLVINFESLPRSVQKRLSQGNRWIKPALHDNKYTWVNFHEQGTIEFRLFGNIDSIDDLLACQTIALEALAYGYQVRFGDYKRKTTNNELRSLAEAV